MTGKIKKRIMAAVLSLAGVIALAGGGYYTWLITPPSMPDTLEDAGRLLVSPRYLRLPQSRRYDYMQRAAALFDQASAEDKKAMIKAAGDSPQAKAALRLAMEDRINMVILDYIKADDFDRRNMMDRLIAMQEIMTSHQKKKQNQKPAAPRSPEDQARRDAARERGKQQFIQQMQQRIETGNPQQQAYFGEFITAYMTRREQLGLDPMPFDPGKR